MNRIYQVENVMVIVIGEGLDTDVYSLLTKDQASEFIATKVDERLVPLVEKYGPPVFEKDGVDYYLKIDIQRIAGELKSAKERIEKADPRCEDHAHLKKHG